MCAGLAKPVCVMLGGGEPAQPTESRIGDRQLQPNNDLFWLRISHSPKFCTVPTQNFAHSTDTMQLWPYCVSFTTSMASIPECIERIKTNALRDNIDLSVLPFLQDALTDISALATDGSKSQLPTFSNASRIDTHAHPVPSWFRALQPLSAGRETPSWDPLSHLQFMDQHSIAHSILCVSTPQANAFPDDKAKTVALARLLNEFSAELVRIYPDRFSWMAVTPLPYVQNAVSEVRYALEELGAVGVGVLTNHEGLYPGEESFDPLWEYLQKHAEEGDRREIVFIHPHDPVIRLEDGRLVASKPCKLLFPRFFPIALCSFI